MGWRGAGKLTRNFATMTLIFLLFVAVAVNEQVSAATVSGIVTDSSDSAVPNATFSIRNTATGDRPGSHDGRTRLLQRAEPTASDL